MIVIFTLRPHGGMLNVPYEFTLVLLTIERDGEQKVFILSFESQLNSKSMYFALLLAAIF